MSVGFVSFSDGFVTMSIVTKSVGFVGVMEHEAVGVTEQEAGGVMVHEVVGVAVHCVDCEALDDFSPFAPSSKHAVEKCSVLALEINKFFLLIWRSLTSVLLGVFGVKNLPGDAERDDGALAVR